jgi:hypothetical protein
LISWRTLTGAGLGAISSPWLGWRSLALTDDEERPQQ